jgi:hypothetical protein
MDFIKSFALVITRFLLASMKWNRGLVTSAMMPEAAPQPHLPLREANTVASAHDCDINMARS